MARRKGKRSKDLDPAEVRRLYEDEGLTLKQVGARVGASPRVVRRVLVLAGGEVRGPARPSAIDDEAALVARYEEGITLDALSEEFGVSVVTVSWCIERHGVGKGWRAGTYRRLKPRKPPKPKGPPKKRGAPRKLSDEEIEEMRRVRETEGLSFVRLGARFGVCSCTARKYLLGKK